MTQTSVVNPALHILTTGERIEVMPANGKSFTLEEMQKFVGGYVEYIYLPKRKIMVVNEEGRLQGLATNVIATGMAAGQADIIVGDVLVSSSKYIK